jgi:hypothetical protein
MTQRFRRGVGGSKKRTDSGQGGVGGGNYLFGFKFATRYMKIDPVRARPAIYYRHGQEGVQRQEGPFSTPHKKENPIVSGTLIISGLLFSGWHITPAGRVKPAGAATKNPYIVIATPRVPLICTRYFPII